MSKYLSSGRLNSMDAIVKRISALDEQIDGNVTPAQLRTARAAAKEAVDDAAEGPESADEASFTARRGNPRLPRDLARMGFWDAIAALDQLNVEEWPKLEREFTDYLALRAAGEKFSDAYSAGLVERVLEAAIKEWSYSLAARHLQHGQPELHGDAGTALINLRSAMARTRRPELERAVVGKLDLAAAFAGGNG